ncbi:hypothetical protein AALP_AA4G264400 [Arabis alpina]|uniref:AMP-dependent synthetase/ligase domain-containing protein n=1 Tax=Arabis alpina TaxID=50452 RepID=A0A087H5U0_ARAAL|nr:hypothetical protein AALP_AA4G264400 [Arabis alpina]
MKSFAAKVEEGVKGVNGKLSVGPVYRNLLPEKGFPPIDSDITTTWDIFSKSVDKFPENKMLGWRQIVDEEVGPYIWKTYKEVYEEVLQVGSALRAAGAEPGCRVGIYGANCPQWIIAMEACAAHTLICVPLYDTLGSGAIDYIVDHAEIDFVFVQNTKIKGLLDPDCKSAKRLKAIVSFTNVSEEYSHKASEIGVKAYSWIDFLLMGRDKPVETNPPKPANVCTIMYTSGTSVEARKLFDQNKTSLDNSTWNMMIMAYVQRGLMLEAHKVFDEMPVRDVVSWNTMFMGLKKSREPERVFRLFLEMRRSGLSPDDGTIPAVIDAVSGSGFKVLVMQIHTVAIRLGLNLSGYTGSSLLRGYTSLRSLKSLERVFEEILVKDVISWNVLIMGYMKLGLVEDGERAFEEMPERNVISWHMMLIGYINNTKIDKARELFDKMSHKNVFSWTVMINGYVQCRDYKVALMLFQEMVESWNNIPSHYTFSTVLKACAASSSLLMGKQVHSMITKRGMGCDIVLATSLIDMYAKSGDITAASRVFKSMPMKNPASWNSMIGGLARHGLGVDALEEFEKMVEGGYKPDQVTFINLLSACAHAGLVEEGEKQFMLMSRLGIVAEKEHYACMVDLLGRAGQLDKAERLIKGMPFEPDVVIWGALLGACGLHSCLELGEVAAQGISRLRREHPAAYDVLCRVHGEKGDWNSVMELRKLMKKTKAKKQDASSWIEAHS